MIRRGSSKTNVVLTGLKTTRAGPEIKCQARETCYELHQLCTHEACTAHGPQDANRVDYEFSPSVPRQGVTRIYRRDANPDKVLDFKADALGQRQA